MRMEFYIHLVRVAKCTTEGDFLDVLEKMKGLLEEAWKVFTKDNPRCYVETFFSPFP